MKKLRVLLALALCAAMIFTLAACVPPEGGDSDINYEIDLSQKPTLNVLMPYSGYTIDQVNENENAKLIEEITGYHVQYTQLPSADSSAVINTELMDKTPYNVMKLTKDQFSDLVMDDMLVDITDALEVFAPDMLQNISAESWEAVTVNGRIYGIPERASSDNIENPIVLNNDLMMSLNLEYPETRDEFTEVLRAMTNALGRPALTFDRYTPLVYAISASFGIYSDWQEYTVDGKTEVLYYMNAPRYKEYVEYMNYLYTEGLIDQEVPTNTAADAVNRFVAGFGSGSTAKASAVACSLWSVTSIVTGMQSNGYIPASDANGELDNYLYYLRALKEDASDQEKVYRSSGYTYIIGIPYYMADSAGYALDWMNSKIKDTDEEHNFRRIVLGEENVHWTYNPEQGYLPIPGAFDEKDDASYYLTGSNETKYTQYWMARVRKQAELFRAWSTLMEDADDVGVHNLADFTPPIEDYNSNRAYMEEYAQDQFYIMMKEGTGNMAEYLNSLNTLHGGDKATKAINEWYSSYKQ